MVRAVELADEDGEPGTASLRARVAMRSPLPMSFLTMTWDEAVAFFAERDIVSVEEFDALQDRFKTGAFVSRTLTGEAMQARAMARIEYGMAEGLPEAQIANMIQDATYGLGIEPTTPARLETIVRNNVSTSYAKGKLDAMSDPDVMMLRPFWQYWSAGDSRVRPAHVALHGKVFEAGSEEALYYTPPLGHNCRCSVTTLSRRQLEKRGLLVSGYIDDVDPDKGWEAPPAPLSLADLGA